ncbi:hypothetical protein BN1326_60194 [Staphylococcus argenteus]|uniref:Uncharacterized protein n=1 Tax=Staphylococcus argenteus TaxID=985002 RepID=A0A7U7JTV6_9STAP|nr:hypothetical protein BN1326_60194 [Staphylococcus argenteus]CRI25899.1 hypothetical protein BN1326_60194 [Staphylococcus argenteus]
MCAIYLINYTVRRLQYNVNTSVELNIVKFIFKIIIFVLEVL